MPTLCLESPLDAVHQGRIPRQISIYIGNRHTITSLDNLLRLLLLRLLRRSIPTTLSLMKDLALAMTLSQRELLGEEVTEGGPHLSIMT